MDNFQTVPFVEDSFETSAQLSQLEVEQKITSPEQRKIRPSVAMIGLAISVGTTAGFLPQFNAPAMAESSVVPENSLIRVTTTEPELGLPQIITGQSTPSVPGNTKIVQQPMVITSGTSRVITQQSAELARSSSNSAIITSQGEKGEELWQTPTKATTETAIAMTEAIKTVVSSDAAQTTQVLSQLKFEQLENNSQVALENESSNQENSVMIPVTLATKTTSIQLNPEQVVLVTTESNLNKQENSTQTVITPKQISEPMVIAPGENVVYQVQAGDTLDQIADRYQSSPTELIKANQIANPNLITVNQQLKIPSDSSQQNEKIENQFEDGTNPYVEKLKADAAKLRQEYNFPDKPKKIVQGISAKSFSESYASSASLTANPEEKAKQTEKQVVANSRKNQPVNTDLEVEVVDKREGVEQPLLERAVAPEDSSASGEAGMVATSHTPGQLYNPNLQTPVGVMLDPSLPPLSSPEEYLPQGIVFNGYKWPAKGVFTSGYGRRWGRMHRGIDVAGPIGTPIMAAADGEVISAGWNSGGYGNLIKLRHGDGSVTVYAHNSRILVRPGQQVDQGQQIAEMGSTGRSTGPHLHFEIHPNGRGAVNPIAFLPRNR